MFNDSTKFFWVKDKNGNWVDGFTPAFMKERPYEGPYFYEGTPWHYSTYVPHDVQGLINKHGGKKQFVAFLDTMFNTGEYTQTNQLDILTPYLYNYAGRPDRKAERVRYLLATEYKLTVDGLPGNDDAGCMSSWYVFGAMGFYPNVGQNVYLVGSPVFDSITLDLGEGVFFKITAKNNSDKNIYVQSAKMNGKVWEKNWFRHKDIVSGGVLELEMGAEPSDWGIGTSPPSVSSE